MAYLDRVKFIVTLLVIISSVAVAQDQLHIRLNLAGYLADDSKVAIAFSNASIRKRNFIVVDEASGKNIFKGEMKVSPVGGFANFKNYYLLDFSDLKNPGTFHLEVPAAKAVSERFRIGSDVYGGYSDVLLEFMRQQRCGYNPFLDVVCHERDGRAMDGPMEDSTYVDARGGWHDAGDQLKYLITGSNATARMLMAYRLFPRVFKDSVNALGQPGSNDAADVLDEGRWGLEWLLRLHPESRQLFHQVGDDRDHIGWKLPGLDPSDYGWGKDSYRVAYFATGKPQGLGKYKSEATGIANIAGRSAAALATGFDVYYKGRLDTRFGEQCLAAAIDLYQMAKSAEGFQQGNSFGAPYRYNEDTWTDDMEWAAAELYKATGQKNFLDDAIRYARMSGTLSWIEKDTTAHYQRYPFLNMGHFALHEAILLDDTNRAMREELAGYYRAGIEKTLARAGKNVFSNGVPFIWCSNNLVVDLILQIGLYERMTKDLQYHSYMAALRDWLLGRNPWGVSMFTGLPENSKSPSDVHTSIWALTKKPVRGGLVDGPIFTSIHSKLLGLRLTHEDRFAAFQNDHVVYHDDIGDYSTNEPTMDGTACAIMMMAMFETGAK